MRLLECGGHPPENTYIFLGDYVRGQGKDHRQWSHTYFQYRRRIPYWQAKIATSASELDMLLSEMFGSYSTSIDDA